MKNKKNSVLIVVVLIFCHIALILHSEELPRPTYDNSLLFSIIYKMQDPPSADMDYMKSQFGGGIYAPLINSSYLTVKLGWDINPADADAGILTFKNSVDSLMEEARIYGVGVHLILLYGLARDTNVYKSSKEEDIRNAQWYCDNNLASREQLEAVFPYNSISMNSYVFGTLSRYARKLRNNLEAKVKAAFDYLKKKQDENPDFHFIVSAPGEPELNYNRINENPVMQQFFCDYSPFSVLEFRDWIKHDGMYSIGGIYEGEGYEKGGMVYRGKEGIENFNDDFGTTFTRWGLKYYNWELSDPVDNDYTDSVNPDPKIIPFVNYTFDGQKPGSGPNFLSGGFDPPRVMRQKGEDPFYDLWQAFRELQVHRYVKDMAKIARESGFAPDHYFTHQIPADYIGGTKPNDPDITLSTRYYSSASPLWTAEAYPDMGIGVSIYDERHGNHVYRTSLFSIPAINSMSNNWGAVEYNPEVILTDNANDISDVDILYPQIMRLYDNNAHVVSFFSWNSGVIYGLKGTKREIAVKQFFEAVKDKARHPLNTVFSPTTVSDFNGCYVYKNESAVQLNWSPLIWSDLKHKWTDWGDFKEFILYRGKTADFRCDAASEIARVKDSLYLDYNLTDRDMNYYYKISASNVKGESGIPVFTNVYVPPKGTPIMNVSTEEFYFGASMGGDVSLPRTFTISNIGEGVLDWTVSANSDWLICSPLNGKSDGVVNVAVNASGKTAGTYTGEITISAGKAVNSPKTINVTLTVYEIGEDSGPKGQFDSPENGGTVNGSVPFTGWAVDDIGVESVKLYLKVGNDKAYIGDAFFVENSRPDIEAAFKTYPGTNRAGFGYMLLTNLLPYKENNQYKIYGVGRDRTGNETMFQSRVIVVSNSWDPRIFGTIETPSQGGVASGKAFVNWGWALAPNPNFIPFDGSTIDVYVDNVMVGHPVYNQFREDIATLFPGYANSNGAMGYYTLDTTQYPNGLHTISWVVKDNAGNTEGIGSRYFWIQN